MDTEELGGLQFTGRRVGHDRASMHPPIRGLCLPVAAFKLRSSKAHRENLLAVGVDG